MRLACIVEQEPLIYWQSLKRKRFTRLCQQIPWILRRLYLDILKMLETILIYIYFNWKHMSLTLKLYATPEIA